MQHIKQMIRTGLLLVTVMVLAVATPLATVSAEEPPETYNYNAETGRWDSSKWRYDAATNTYVPVTTPQPTPPTPEPAPVETSDDEPAPAALSESTISDTGPDSNSTTDNTASASSATSTTSHNSIDNTIDSDATTGNASVNTNGKAGSAGTGNASADATVINTVHSTVSGDNGGVAHFTADIYGDVHGTITIGPNIGGTASSTSTTTTDRETNVDNESQITNNINLNATSGDADVTKNGEAGDATSGDASATANLINLVNTIIGANESFVGTINIHGNVYGDILISSEFIPQLIADNSDAVMTMDMPLSTNINDDQTIVNNINLNATTGDASVDNNTQAGNATSGTAQTKLTVLNLTGREVDAETATLVFVNVKGKWVGLIVDAGQGATAAAFGGGMTKNTVKDSSELNVDNETAITNNINLTAQSGDASVASNTKAGNAKTGNATAGANISNISNSKLNVRSFVRWLFINIDGDFNGLVKLIVDAKTGKAEPITIPIPSQAAPAPTAHSLGLEPAPTPVAQTIMRATGGVTPTDEEASPEVQAVLASAKTTPAEPQPVVSTPVNTPRVVGIDPIAIAMMVGGGLTAIGPLLFGLARRLFRL